MNIDSKLVRELAELLAETGLSEIEVEDGDRKIKVARQLTARGDEVIARTHAELDLTDAAATDAFFAELIFNYGDPFPMMRRLKDILDKSCFSRSHITNKDNIHAIKKQKIKNRRYNDLLKFLIEE